MSGQQANDPRRAWRFDGLSVIDGNGRTVCTLYPDLSRPDYEAIREYGHLIAAAPELLEALLGLSSLLESIRDDTVSTHFRFGATEAERKNRVSQLLAYIEANAERVDDALEAARAALSKASGAAS